MMLNSAATFLNLLTRDFCLGVFVTAAGVILHQLYRFLWYGPTLTRIQAIANAPVRHVGADDTITIFGGNGPDDPMVHKGVTDISPFCMRVEAYLRWIHQPYVKRVHTNFSENPRHKIPFANVFGEMVDDSSRIIDAIQRKLPLENDNLKLTKAQRTTGHFVQTVLFQGLYFVFLHALSDTAWGHKLIMDLVDQKIPPVPLLRPLLVRSLIQNEHANLWGQGFGRYPEAYIVEKAMKDFEALSVTLGDDKFILGTKQPTQYDIDLYSMLAGCVIETAEVPPLSWMVAAKKQYPNLVEHTLRMKQILFPEIAKEVEGEYLAEEA